MVCGYTLALGPAFIGAEAAAALAMVGAVVLSRRGGGESALAAWLLPMALLNALWALPAGAGAATLACQGLGVLAALGCMRCCTGPSGWRKAAAALAVLAAIALALAGPMAWLARHMGISQVLRTVPSPSGAHVAEVVDVDEGALGGATVVRCRCGGGWQGLLLRLTPASKRLYVGPWGQGEVLTVSWQGEHTVLINGVGYGVD